MSAASGWHRVSKPRPCPACGADDWCAWTPTGDLKCERVADPPTGFERVKQSGGGAIFRPVNTARGNGRPPRESYGNPAPRTEAAPPVTTDWAAAAERFEAAITVEQIKALAASLGVTPDSLRAIGCGWATAADLRAMRAFGAGWSENPPDGAFVFPERDGGGRVVGLSLRAPDGRKGAPRHSKRGLIVPRTLKDATGAVLCVEGSSDVAAALSMGLMAVGRPSNVGGAEHLATLLKCRKVIVLGENDQKESGAWPGRDGAQRVAGRLAASWKDSVSVAFPPHGSKDTRAWLQSRLAAGLDLSDEAARKAAGAELLAALQADAEEIEPSRRSQAEALVELALEMFRLGRTDSDEAFAVRLDGANVAIPLRGRADALRATLAREFRRRYGSTPNAAALTDAMNVLMGEALDAEPEPVSLRLAEHDGGIVIDLGDSTGRAVIVRPGAWELVEESPILFKRTPLTGPMPEPERGGSLDELRDLLNVSDSDWALLVGYLVAGLIPNIAHAILMLGGLYGTGKSMAGRMLVGLIDPSCAPLRTQPKAPDDWAAVAAGSWAVCIDNVSSIPPWLSDALCRAVTEDAWCARMYYTNGDIFVMRFRRVLMLTAIDAGALRGDLGDRLLLIDLERIPDDRRRSETEILAAYERLRPRVLGALFDLLARVLAELPNVELAAMPRMADFARVLAAVDAIRGADSLGAFVGQRGRVASDVIDADAVGQAIVALAARGDWRGTPTELHTMLTPDRPPAGWPRNAKALSGRLKGIVPALRLLGVAVDFERSGRGRSITIRQVGESCVTCVTCVTNPCKCGAERGDASADRCVTGASQTGFGASQGRAENGDIGPEKACGDASDANDVRIPALSDSAISATDPPERTELDGDDDGGEASVADAGEPGGFFDDGGGASSMDWARR